MIQAIEFAERRQKLIDLMQEGSVAIIFSGVPKVCSADEDYPFEVNRNFYYLTGINQEDSKLVILKTAGRVAQYLFVSPYDEKKEKWYGKKLTIAEASEISGLGNVLSNTGFESKVATLLGDPETAGEVKYLYLDHDREIKVADDTYLSDYKATIQAAFPSMETIDVYPLITTLRLIKSRHEIAELRNAIRSTKIGLLAVWKKLAPGVREFELADEFLRVINDDNSYQGLSFPTIMASGKHAAILHYPTPLDIVKDGDLVLMDLGAKNGFYCADVTRTLPANGKFSEEQRKIYNIVLETNEMVSKMAKPGITIEELQNATVENLAKRCLEEGFIEKKEDISKYYFHGVSHLIGLDTHDPYLSPLSRESKKIPLEPGMVISNEPGLYMADRGIGIRIEDDLLITEDGCEVLTASIIKSPDEIEKYLATKF